MSKRKQERRFYSASRVSAIVHVDVRLNAEKTLSCKSSNISQTGILLDRQIPLQADEVVELLIHLPKAKPMNALARIARHIGESIHRKTALQLLEVGKEEQEIWLTYIAQIERFHSEDEAPTTAARLLAQRQNTGLNHRNLMVRFKNLEDLQHFVEGKIKLGKIYINTSIPKTPGDEVQLLLLHPERKESFKIMSKISNSADALINKAAAQKGLTLELEEFSEADLDQFCS